MIIQAPDKNSSEPLYIQLFNQMAGKIVNGIIPDGTKLPSQRGLAKRLGVSVNTVVNTYNMLVRYGYVNAVVKSGYYVDQPKENIYEPEKIWRSRTTFPSVYNFSKNGVDRHFSPSFKKIWRQTAKEYTDGDFSYPDYIGEYELRKQICLTLKKTAELECEPEQVIVGANILFLLETLMRVLGAEKTYAFENPVFSKISDFLRIGSTRVKYVNVTTEGISEEDLKGLNADALFLMPYHHYPLSYSMTEKQKRDSVNWAAEDRYLIEYGYDIEFADDDARRTLFSMSQNVIFINDFTRSVSPRMNTAYIVLPEKLVKRWHDMYTDYHSLASEIEQRFLAQIMHDGCWSRNCARLKRLYDKKRACFISAVRSHSIGDRIKIINCGCGPFLLIEPQTGCSDVTLIDECHKAGVKLSYLKSGAVIPNKRISSRCYLLGMGQLSESEIKNGVKTLLDTWEGLMDNGGKENEGSS